METSTGLRMDRFAKLVKVVRETGGGERSRWRPAVVPAAGRPGAVGGGVLPHEPHDAAARPALRGFAGHRLPGHPAPAAVARSGAGSAAGRRCRAVVDRGRHPGPGPRPAGRRLEPRLPVLAERAGHRRRRPRLVVASARPAPGIKADAHVWRDFDLPAAATGTTVIAHSFVHHRAAGPLWSLSESSRWSLRMVPFRPSTRRRPAPACWPGYGRPSYGIVAVLPPEVVCGRTPCILGWRGQLGPSCHRRPGGRRPGRHGRYPCSAKRTWTTRNPARRRSG